MNYKELIAKALSSEILATCTVGIRHRRGSLEVQVEKPLACFHLLKGSLVDPWGTQIPLHRLSCLRCKDFGFGNCKESHCQVLRTSWTWAVVCQCNGGKAVRAPRGFDPVFALRGPPYPLVSNGTIVGCVPEGSCDGELVKRGYWYWYF